MKVTVKNPSNKPINISKLAPLMPVMVLGVNQEIVVNVRDIDSVMSNAKVIGVTVTPMNGAFEVTEIVEPDIGETVSNDETHPDSNEVAPETVKTEEDNKGVDEKKSKTRKSSEVKKSTRKSIFGNNK